MACRRPRRPAYSRWWARSTSSARSRPAGSPTGTTRGCSSACTTGCAGCPCSCCPASSRPACTRACSCSSCSTGWTGSPRYRRRSRCAASASATPGRSCSAGSSPRTRSARRWPPPGPGSSTTGSAPTTPRSTWPVAWRSSPPCCPWASAATRCGCASSSRTDSPVDGPPSRAVRCVVVATGEVGVRVRPGALATAIVLALAGCAGPASGSPRTPASAPAPAPSREPAEAAGGACQLMSFDQVAAALAVDFGAAGAGNTGDTYTCVLRKVESALPDLSLTVSPTVADPAVFKASVTPKGSTPLGALGKIGYSRTVPAAAGGGPGAAGRLLASNQRLMILRYRTAPDTPPGDVTALVPKLVDLAKKVDQASA